MSTVSDGVSPLPKGGGGFVPSKSATGRYTYSEYKIRVKTRQSENSYMPRLFANHVFIIPYVYKSVGKHSQVYDVVQLQ